MATTTDYEEWMGGLQPNTEEIHSVYNAVEREASFGGVSVTQNENGTWLVSYPSPLGKDLILTGKSREAFLKYIIQEYCNGKDIESWQGFQLNMDKIDDKQLGEI